MASGSPPSAGTSTDDMAPRISTLRDHQDGMAALVLRFDQYVIVTVPSRREVELGGPEEFYAGHRREVLRVLDELRAPTRPVHIVRYSALPWWRRTRRRQLMMMMFIKVVLVVASVSLAMYLEEWNMLLYWMICLSYGCIVNMIHQYLRETSWMLRFCTTFCLFWCFVMASIDLYVPTLKSTCILVLGAAVLFTVGFWKATPPIEERPAAYERPHILSMSTVDGLLRMHSFLHDRRAIPLSCVQSFRPSFFQHDGQRFEKKFHFVAIDKGQQFAPSPLAMASERIAELIAHELNEALQLWRSRHGPLQAADVSS